MALIDADKIRNVVLLSHSGAGTTSLVETLLFNTKAINRIGTVEAGSTVSDYEPEEHRRESSIQTSVIPCLSKGYKSNFLDTPGYDDFRGEVISALRVVEGAVVVVSGVSGVEVGTEQSWNFCEDKRIPRIIFVNKLDRDNADFQRSLDSIQAMFGRKCVPVQLPIGAAQDFKGVVNLLDPSSAPSELTSDVSTARERLIEAIAESDDDLATKYLEGEELGENEIGEGLKKAVLSGDVVPVLLGSATQNIGVERLQEAVISYLPSPLDVDQLEGTSIDPSSALAALVFKTTADPFVGKLSYFRVYDGTFSANTEVWNSTKEESERIGQVFNIQGKGQEPTQEIGPGDIGAVSKLASTVTGDTHCHKDKPVVLKPVVFSSGYYSMAVYPKSSADLDKMSTSLTRIVEEDPSLKLTRDPSTGESIISGLGDVHLDTAIEKVKRKFGAELTLQLPKVPYRETITAVTNSEYKHKKQSGGHGQYGHVLLRLEPGERNSGFEFAQSVVGGSVPKEYIPAVEKGVVKALTEGSIAGFPVVDVKVVLTDGSYHDVDSSGMAFEIASSAAFRRGMLDGNPIVLEPIVKLSVRASDSFTGDIIGDLNGKRGRIIGMIPESGSTIIEADVPHAEVLRYSTELRSLTQGRASYTMEFSHYEAVPPVVGQKLANDAQRTKDEARA